MNDNISIKEFEHNLDALKPFRWLGQTVLFKTHKWGKDYIWLRDGEGVHHMLRVDEKGFPIL